MSTSYFVSSYLKELIRERGMDIVPHADNDDSMVECERDYIIIRNYDEKKLFQGNIDRCSDFFRGYLACLEVKHSL